MTPKTTSLLTDTQPHCHIVYPSSDEQKIDEAVAVFASAGIRKGEGVILVSTSERRAFIESRLQCDGHDVKAAEYRGQLTFLEAAPLLAAFTEAGTPNAALFKTAVSGIIEKAGINPSTGKPRKVRIFGEMVSLLYMADNVAAAERLEEFWNELVEAHSISLFCAYSLKAYGDVLPQPLLDAHSEHIN